MERFIIIVTTAFIANISMISWAQWINGGTIEFGFATYAILFFIDMMLFMLIDGWADRKLDKEKLK